MSMDLRTISITPLRQTFGHLARRMGADKPATRYMEATMDLQPVENFHYRPTWEPQYEIFDARRTRTLERDRTAVATGARTLGRSRTGAAQPGGVGARRRAESLSVFAGVYRCSGSAAPCVGIATARGAG